MRRVIGAFDAWLRKRHGVFEFAHETDCLLRLRVARLRHSIDLPSRRLPSGSVVLELHLWNEHLPPIPSQGPDVAWASRARRLFLRSIRSAARYAAQLQGDEGPQAVGATTVLVPLGDTSGAGSFLIRLGFHLIPACRPLGSFGEFWENLYTWALMWTFNTPSLRGRRLLQIRRMEAWMPFDEFLRRYASDSPTA